MPRNRPDALPLHAMPGREISILIAAPFDAVCRFLADPANWPFWAAGLGSLARGADGSWTTRNPDGRTMTVTFAAPNDAGRFDHIVTPADGAPPIHVPLRATRDGEATRVTLTLFRQPEMDDAAFERDAAWVKEDLARLKMSIDEGKSALE